MRLYEEILKTKEKLKRAERDVEVYSEIIKHLEKATEMYFSELVTTQDSLGNILNINKQIGTYKVILGGDGRSAPWDKDEEGLVAIVTKVKAGIYISQETKDKYSAYLKLTDDTLKHVQWV